jgi:ornithine carbamoyltransferase
MVHVDHLKHFSASDLAAILARAQEIKADPKAFRQALAEQSLAMLFQKTSTRTRVSFEVAMTELGGHALFLDWQSSNFVLTDLRYEIEYLSRNVDVIMARLLKNADFKIMTEASQVPMINGCCERYHPCQALTDVLTMTEFSDKPLAELHLLYTGVQNNVSNSLIIMADRFGFQLTLATPPADPKQESYDADIQTLVDTNAYIQQVADPREVIERADFVYTDTWIDMQYFNDPSKAADKADLIERMSPFQINLDLVGNHPVRIMHDMPIHNDYEITEPAVRDSRAIIFEQAANRLHAQKGLLHWLLLDQ